MLRDRRRLFGFLNAVARSKFSKANNPSPLAGANPPRSLTSELLSAQGVEIYVEKCTIYNHNLCLGGWVGGQGRLEPYRRHIDGIEFIGNCHCVLRFRDHFVRHDNCYRGRDWNIGWPCLDDIGNFGAEIMTLSYLALALAIVLLLAGIAGAVFTFRTIVQRRAKQPPDFKTRTLRGISS
jgi:hypothetical protein